MHFAIKLYPNATQTTEDGSAVGILGEPSETVAEFDVDYPAEALVAAEPTILATRTETQQRWIKGKKRTMTTFRGGFDVSAAWMTARGLMALTAQPTPAESA